MPAPWLQLHPDVAVFIFSWDSEHSIVYSASLGARPRCHAARGLLGAVADCFSFCEAALGAACGALLYFSVLSLQYIEPFLRFFVRFFIADLQNIDYTGYTAPEWYLQELVINEGGRIAEWSLGMQVVILSLSFGSRAMPRLSISRGAY